MVKALAVAKNVVSLSVCTMAKTLVNSACIHRHIFLILSTAARSRDK